MSETSENVGENVAFGPDLFGLYRSELAELLAQDADFFPLLHQSSRVAENVGLGRENCTDKSSCSTKQNNSFRGSTLLYSNGVGALLSEFGKERLKLLLRESAFTLSKEVDEVIDPVISLYRVRSCLRYKDNFILSSNELPQPVDQQQHPCNKVQIDDDIRFLLEHDSTRVEELLNSHSDELYKMLQHMEQKLEELLDVAMKTCRPMTVNEKQQLRKSIRGLQPKNVNRVLEILGRSKACRKDSCDEIHVDLDEVDQVTQWRLYFYVAAIENAKTL